MNKKFIFLILALGGVGIWYFLGQSDEKKIKKIIHQIESVMLEPAPKALPQILRRVNKAGRHFYPSVHIKLEVSDYDTFEIKSRREVESLLAQALFGGYKAEKPFKEIKSLQFPTPEQAVLEIQILVKGREQNFDIKITAQLKKEKGDWLIYKVTGRGE